MQPPANVLNREQPIRGFQRVVQVILTLMLWLAFRTHMCAYLPIIVHLMMCVGPVETNSTADVIRIWSIRSTWKRCRDPCVVTLSSRSPANTTLIDSGRAVDTCLSLAAR